MIRSERAPRSWRFYPGALPGTLEKDRNEGICFILKLLSRVETPFDHALPSSSAC